VDVGLAAAGAPQRAVAVGADVQVPGVVFAGHRPADGAFPAVGGLTAAHELAERGYELDDLEGDARTGAERAIEALDGHDVAVVVTDTLGRPWRLGQTDVAVGLAGMGALDDWRGRTDGDGRLLEVTEVAVADEVAAAADLVKGKASRVPAALLRGVPRPKGDGTARDLVRPPADDLFRTAGTAEDLIAFLEGAPPPSAFLPDPVDPALLGAAAHTAREDSPRHRLDGCRPCAQSPSSAAISSASLTSSSEPRSMHGVVPQTWTWKRPTGARLNMV
jgi:hypothetical protein